MKSLSIYVYFIILTELPLPSIIDTTPQLIGSLVLYNVKKSLLVSDAVTHVNSLPDKV